MEPRIVKIRLEDDYRMSWPEVLEKKKLEDMVVLVEPDEEGLILVLPDARFGRPGRKISFVNKSEFSFSLATNIESDDSIVRYRVIHTFEPNSFSYEVIRVKMMENSNEANSWSIQPVNNCSSRQIFKDDWKKIEEDQLWRSII